MHVSIHSILLLQALQGFGEGNAGMINSNGAVEVPGKLWKGRGSGRDLHDA